MRRLAGLLALLLSSPALAGETVIAVVAQTSGEVVFAPAAGGETTRVEIGELPASVAAGPDGRTLYVTHPDRGRVTVVDAVTRRPTATFAVKGQPFGAAATDEFVYVSDWTGGVLIKLDALTGATLAESPVGDSPAALVLDKAGARAFVAGRQSDSVSVVDLATMTETTRVPVGRAPFALAMSPDGSRLYVANVQSGDLSVVDVDTLKELKRVPVGRMPYGVAVTPDGSRVAVTLQHDNALAIVDAAKLETIAKVKVGAYPEGVSIIADGRRAAVANWFDDSISLVDLDGPRVVETRKVGAGPRGLVTLDAD